MRFVVDQPVSPSVAEWLRAKGHDAFHLRERGLSRLPDEGVFDLAFMEQRIIVTADLDFPRIVALSGLERPGVVCFRPGNLSDAQMLGLLEKVLQHVEPHRLESAVTVVDQRSVRVAPASPQAPRLRVALV